MDVSGDEWGSERMFRGMHKEVVVLSNQGGARVLPLDNEGILKVGSRVLPSEEVAMRLAKEHTDIPVPEILFSAYIATEGRIVMTLIPGTPLKMYGIISPTQRRNVSAPRSGLWLHSFDALKSLQSCSISFSALLMGRPVSKIQWLLGTAARSPLMLVC
jgi:hypothetical protein